MLNLTLFEENRYHSNVMLVDCNLGEEYEGQNINNYIQRFIADMKVVLKEADALRLINIDTINERYKRKSRLLQFFYSNLMKDAKSIVIYTNNPDSDVNYLFSDFFISRDRKSVV